MHEQQSVFSRFSNAKALFVVSSMRAMLPPEPEVSDNKRTSEIWQIESSIWREEIGKRKSTRQFGGKIPSS